MYKLIKMSINCVDDTYSWKNMSLWEYLTEGNIPSGWEEFFLRSDVQQQLIYISNELDNSRNQFIIYPPIYQVFRAFYLTPLDKITAIIIGQDPYHSGTTEYDGSAIGLCFSVKSGNTINPSLKNIYKELKSSGFEPNENGDLIHWAKQGVLMLNMGLTVEKGDADSHTSIWHKFSEMVVKYIDQKRKDSVHWLLFGSPSIKVGENNVRYGKIHKASHPSGLSCYRASKLAPAFFGSKVFLNVPKIKW